MDNKYIKKPDHLDILADLLSTLSPFVKLKMGPKIKCLKCNDIIQSKYRHHFLWCDCGNIFVDGGSEYTRIGGKGIEDNSYEFLKEI